ncbi:Trp biosynthesis-associated membrane protein [Frankia tisae]|uniref:Trp biosynthesis-associated membrane protein n=1 Tax=Frankia tisae TaxID=2950104 RepID=UPI0021BE7133|nr:Trp biosynthesis-associated membrane protein [Frankia tisae]
MSAGPPARPAEGSPSAESDGLPADAPAAAADDLRAMRAARRGRRERVLAVVGCLLGAGLVLVCSGATWISARVGTPRGGLDATAVAAPLAVHWTGGDIASAATALALVGLAAAVAIIATRRIGRPIVGLLAVAAGIGIAYVAVHVGSDPLAALRDTDQVRQFAPGGRAEISGVHRTVAPWLAMLGGVLLTAAGGLAVLRGRSWPGMSGRYQAREARPVDAWDAIERGRDPT